MNLFLQHWRTAFGSFLAAGSWRLNTDRKVLASTRGDSVVCHVPPEGKAYMASLAGRPAAALQPFWVSSALSQRHGFPSSWCQEVTMGCLEVGDLNEAALRKG